MNDTMNPNDQPDVSNAALAAIGFDVNSPGLETITDPAVRTRILRAFRDEHRPTGEVVTKSVVDGDRTAARELLHKLMGSTATIGLPALRTAVIELHTTIHESPDDIPAPLIVAFTTELERVLTELDVLGPAA